MLLAVLFLAILATALAAGCQRGGWRRRRSEDRALGLHAEQPVLRDLARRRAEAPRTRPGWNSSSPTRRTTPPPQQDDIQNFVTQQVNVILVNPVDSEAIVPAIEAANQANIPVIALDRGASGGELATTIASDNVQGGRMAGEELIRLVGSGQRRPARRHPRRQPDTRQGTGLRGCDRRAERGRARRQPDSQLRPGRGAERDGEHPAVQPGDKGHLRPERRDGPGRRTGPRRQGRSTTSRSSASTPSRTR